MYQQLLLGSTYYKNCDLNVFSNVAAEKLVIKINLGISNGYYAQYLCVATVAKSTKS